MDGGHTWLRPGATLAASRILDDIIIEGGLLHEGDSSGWSLQ